MLADDRADNDRDELVADLLGVEVELLAKDEWCANDNGDVSVGEFDAVCDPRNQDAREPGQEQGLEETAEPNGARVDATRDKFREARPGFLGNGGILDIKSLFTEQNIGDELNSIDNGKDPVDPGYT